MARKLGVRKHEIFRLETAERNSRIVMATLMRAADALGCELVYALAPKAGSLEDLAAIESAEREKVREKVRAKEERKRRKIEELIDWRGAIRQMLRKELRKAGIRVR
jgi:transcriptional regulator with XRE-family HTH domain